MSASRQVLIVYYSLSGNTARVATDLAKRLDADVESIRDEQHGTGGFGLVRAAFDALRKAPAKIGPTRFDPSKYAITFIGTPVWVGQMTPAVRAYLGIMRGKFRNVAFFVTSGDTDVVKIAPSMEVLAQCTASACSGFNAKELKDMPAYERKLSAFGQQAGLVATRQNEQFAAEPTHSPAHSPV
jgi:flavodoxin